MPQPDDTFDGPRRDPDLGPPKQPESVAAQTEKVELATRARRLQVMNDQAKLIERANDMTRFKRPAAA